MMRRFIHHSQLQTSVHNLLELLTHVGKIDVDRYVSEVIKELDVIERAAGKIGDILKIELLLQALPIYISTAVRTEKPQEWDAAIDLIADLNQTRPLLQTREGAPPYKKAHASGSDTQTWKQGSAQTLNSQHNSWRRQPNTNVMASLQPDQRSFAASRPNSIPLGTPPYFAGTCNKCQQIGHKAANCTARVQGNL